MKKWTIDRSSAIVRRNGLRLRDASYSDEDGNQAEFTEYTLPGNVEIPSALEVELEDDDSTLIAFYVDNFDIAIRISSISFTKPGSDEDAAAESVQLSAEENGSEYFEIGDNAVAHYEEESEQEGDALIIKFWHIGALNTIVIISATILKECRQSPVVERVLGFMPRILDSLNVTLTHRVVESDGIQVEATVQTVEPTPQEFSEFGDVEKSWLEDSIRSSRELGLKYGSGGDLDPEELDRVFSRWMYDEDEKETPELVADALGAAFGEFLIEQLGFHWTIVTDEYGTEFAVKHELGSTVAFPRASVEKRIEDQEPEFFQDVCVVIVDNLRRAAEDESDE